MLFETIDLIAGDQTDFQLRAWVTLGPSAVGPVLQMVTISSELAFDWTLFFADGVGAAPRDVVVADSATAEATIVAPVTVQIGNRSRWCPMLVPRNQATGLLPMTLRLSTSGKTNVARVRIAWNWWEENGPGL